MMFFVYFLLPCGYMVTVVTVTIFLRRLGLAGGNISSRSVQYSFSQGKSLGIAGRETASCKCLPIPKQLCAYTQTAVRLYPISIAKICCNTIKSPLPSAIIHQPSYISHHTSAIILRCIYALCHEASSAVWGYRLWSIRSTACGLNRASALKPVRTFRQ